MYPFHFFHLLLSQRIYRHLLQNCFHLTDGRDVKQIAGTWNTKQSMLQIPWRYISYFKSSKNLWCTISHTPTSANVNPVKTNLRWAAAIKNRTVCCIHQRWVSLLTNWCTTLSDHFLSCLKILGVREWNNSQGCKKPNTHHNTAIYT